LLDVVLAQLRDKPLRQLLVQFSSRAMQAGLVMLAYQLIVGIHVNGWVRQNSEKISSLHDLPLIKTNFVDFHNYIGAGFGEQWWLYFAPILALMMLFPVAVGIRYALKSRRTQPAGVTAVLFVIGLLMPVAFLASVLGPMLLLVKPLIVPRVLIGVGALLVAALIIMHAAFREWGRSDKWSLAVACFLALGMCAVASAYGNALGEQKDYEERIAARLADDLADLRATDSVKAFLLDGTAGYSPITAHVVEQFPLIRSLIPTYISADDMFHTHIFLLYFIPDMDDMRLRTDPETVKLKANLLARICQTSATRTTKDYSLYLIDNVAVVEFKPSHAQHCGCGHCD
ncbi:MAG: hypothetical protein ACREPT_04740, partial [Rudaea sp.]